MICKSETLKWCFCFCRSSSRPVLERGGDFECFRATFSFDHHRDYDDDKQGWCFVAFMIYDDDCNTFVISLDIKMTRIATMKTKKIMRCVLEQQTLVSDIPSAH